MSAWIEKYHDFVVGQAPIRDADLALKNERKVLF